MPWIETRRTKKGIVYWVFDRVNGKRVFVRAGVSRQAALQLKAELTKKREAALAEYAQKRLDQIYGGAK